MKFHEKDIFFTPPPPPGLKWNRNSPLMPRSANSDLYHVIHKVPAGDSPYVRAKRAQMIDKDLSKAISLFRAAINSGDRVDSALKDMVVVMKQLNRSDEAIEAIQSFRRLCPPESQESIDNLLLELYKKSGRHEEVIRSLHVKLNAIEEDFVFAGKRTKTCRSQGKKTQIPIEKEYLRLLGNLAWSYLQTSDYKSAEEYYRKALSFELDKNKQCNLALCLIHLNKMNEAELLLQTVKASYEGGQMDESSCKSYERAAQMLIDCNARNPLKVISNDKVMSRTCPRFFSPCERRNFKGYSKPASADQDVQGETVSFSDAKGEQWCTSNTAVNVRLMEVAENDLKITDPNQQLGNCSVNLQVYASQRKSLANMVEEDEEELHNAISDEDKNPNIIVQTPLHQREPLDKNIESHALTDGYYTQPLHCNASLKNHMTRQSLFFDQHQKLDRVETFFSSPLLNKNLGF